MNKSPVNDTDIKLLIHDLHFFLCEKHKYCTEVQFQACLLCSFKHTQLLTDKCHIKVSFHPSLHCSESAAHTKIICEHVRFYPARVTYCANLLPNPPDNAKLKKD